jgi:hypothetical protein
MVRPSVGAHSYPVAALVIGTKDQQVGHAGRSPSVIFCWGVTSWLLQREAWRVEVRAWVPSKRYALPRRQTVLPATFP